MWAPRSTARTAAARVASSRSSGARPPRTRPRKALREKPRSRGRPRARKSAARRRISRLCSTVAGIVLHRRRRALHVHEDGPRAGAGHDAGHGRVEAEGADVVDDVGPGVEGGPGHGGLGRVDGDEGPALAAQAGDDRDDAGGLLGLGHGPGAGAGALAPDVDDVGAFGDERQAVGDGPGGIGVPAAVRERIGGDVDDAHEPGPGAELEAAAPDVQAARLSAHGPGPPPAQLSRVSAAGAADGAAGASGAALGPSTMALISSEPTASFSRRSSAILTSLSRLASISSRVRS